MSKFGKNIIVSFLPDGELAGLPGRAIFFLVICSLCFLTPPETREVVRNSVSDAYLQVGVFVALTLAVFYLFEHIFKLDTDYFLQKYEKYHIPIASFMGALPGCGGAIMVITQYVAGKLSFGAVVAVLCSTMGDAAFLLLAQEPFTALAIYAVSMIAGVICGYVVQIIHGKDFLKGELKEQPGEDSSFAFLCGMKSRMSPLRLPWFVMMIPGCVFGIAGAFQVDTDAWFGSGLAGSDLTMWFGLFGALLSCAMWVLAPNSGPSVANLSCNVAGLHPYKCVIDRVAVDTNFVMAWVISAFLMYELTLLWLDLDLEAFLVTWRPLMPLAAVLIGFIPGCGPQILVTTMYLGGLVPLSAQIGNAISNDGDALFPAVALAPKAAFLATLYTAIPALVLSYGWYFLVEV